MTFEFHGKYEFIFAVKAIVKSNEGQNHHYTAWIHISLHAIGNPRVLLVFLLIKKTLQESLVYIDKW